MTVVEEEPVTADGYQWFKLSGSDGTQTYTGWAALLDANTGAATTVDNSADKYTWNFTRIQRTASGSWLGDPDGYIYLASQDTTSQADYEHTDCWLEQNSGYAVDFTGTNPTLGDLKTEIESLSAKYQVPVEIIAAVAYQESGLYQYGADGFVVHNLEECKQAFNGTNNNTPPGLGLMQLTGSTATSMASKMGVPIGQFISDWRCNCEAGVRVLVDKYEYSISSDPEWMLTLDKANRGVLENWYYALKFYNGSTSYPSTIFKLIANPPERLNDIISATAVALPNTVISDWVYPDGFVVESNGTWHSKNNDLYAGAAHLGTIAGPSISIESTDLVFNVGSSVSIVGTVLDSAGNGVAGVLVSADDPIKSRDSCVLLGTTDANGHFTISYTAEQTAEAEKGTYPVVLYADGATVTVCITLKPSTATYTASNLQLTAGLINGVLSDSLTRSISTTVSSIVKATTDELVSAAKSIAQFGVDWWNSFYDDTTTDYINQVAFVGATSCVVPGNAVCAASVGYLSSSVTESAIVSFMDTVIERSTLTTNEKNQAQALVDGGEAVYDVFILEAGDGILNFLGTIESLGDVWVELLSPTQVIAIQASPDGSTVQVAVAVLPSSETTAPTITSVSPTVLEPVTLGTLQTLTVYGTGFTTATTLQFEQGGIVYDADPSRLRYVSSTELQYSISVGDETAEWTVTAINGTTASNTVSFSVAEAIDTADPAAPVSISSQFVGVYTHNLFYVYWDNPTDATGISKVWYKLGSAPTSNTDGICLDVPLFQPLPIATDTQQTVYIWLEDGAGNVDYTHYSSILLTPPSYETPEAESNDISVTATPLAWPLPEDPMDSALYTVRGVGTIGTVSDVDYWSVELLARDVVSISVDTPNSDLCPKVELYNASGSQLTYDGYDNGWGNQGDSGPDRDVFISHYTIVSSGKYYVKVSNVLSSSPSGSYELRADVVRGSTQLESDANYSNDSISGADVLTLTETSAGHMTGTVAGTTMASEGSNVDEDYYQLGTLNAGNVVELSVRLPSSSSWGGIVVVVDADGNAVADTDGDLTDSHFLGTVTSAGKYYAKVVPVWTYNGHTYLMTDGSMTWTAAEAYAEEVGGHLVTINDAAENAWVQTFVDTFGWVWLGYTDEAVEGTWAWASGESATYTNWASSRPDNSDSWYGKAEADYAWMQYDGTWDDAGTQPTMCGLIELDGSGSDGGSTGTWAQYLLDVDVADVTAPEVVSVSSLPEDGGSTSSVVDKLVVTVSEDLAPATVNVNSWVYSYNGHAYVLTSGSMTWADAEAYAESLGGHLVTINDAAENAWATSLISNYGAVWIGLTDEATEGTWVWSNGESATYRNWASGEPSGGTEDYAELYSGGTWNDLSGSNTFYGLIEIDGTDSDGDGMPDSIDSYPTDGWNNFDLREAGADGVFDTSDDVVYQLTVDPTYTTGTSVELYIEQGPLPTGYYRLTMNSTLTDRAGNALDGNSDGTGGDAYQRYFYVSIPADETLENGSNNTQGTATALTLTETPSGSGYLVAYGMGSIRPTRTVSDVDYWSVELLAGDVVSISVDAADGSRVNSYVALINPSGSGGTSNSNSGSGDNAFISCYTITTSGKYYIYVDSDYSKTGAYNLRVDVARNGVQLESDGDYSNDSISGANVLTLTTVGSQRVATVAGTIMASETNNVDEDYFNVGTIQAGETLFISVRLPGGSTLVPTIEVRDATGALISLEPNPSTTVGRVDIESTSTYYVMIVGTEGDGFFGQYLLDIAIWPTGSLQTADLVVSDVTVPTSAAIGGTLDVTWITGNYGTGSTDSVTWYDRIVLSKNDTYGDNDDIELTYKAHSGTLAANQTYTTEAIITIPAVEAGDYWVFVETDSSDVVYGYLSENNNVCLSSAQITLLDVTSPTVTVNRAAGQDKLTNNSSIHFTVIFSETVTGFTADDVLLGGTASGKQVVKVTGSGTTYDLEVTATGNGTVTVTIAAGAAYDAAGNASEASTSTDNTVTYDNILPTATVAIGNGSSRRSTIQSLHFTFSEDVFDSLTTDDLHVRNITTGEDISTSDMTLTIDESTCTATWTFTGLTGGKLAEGNYVVTLDATGVNDAAGNAMAEDYAFEFHVLYGDATGDGYVNALDLLKVRQNYLKAAGDRDECADVTGDGAVNALDLLLVRQNYLDVIEVPFDLVVSATDIAVSEGGTAEITVALSTAPRGTVEVTVMFSSGDEDVSIQSATTLTFDSTNWNTPQTITLVVAEDADTVDGTAEFVISAANARSSQVVTVTELDNDAVLAGLAMSQPATDLEESETVGDNLGEDDVPVSDGEGEAIATSAESTTDSEIVDVVAIDPVDVVAEASEATNDAVAVVETTSVVEEEQPPAVPQDSSEQSIVEPVVAVLVVDVCEVSDTTDFSATNVVVASIDEGESNVVAVEAIDEVVVQDTDANDAVAIITDDTCTTTVLPLIVDDVTTQSNDSVIVVPMEAEGNSTPEGSIDSTSMVVAAINITPLNNADQIGDSTPEARSEVTRACSRNSA